MEIIKETAFNNVVSHITPEMNVTYIKLISCGKNSIEEAKSNVEDFLKKIANQEGFFLISLVDDLRASLHSYVDQLCDAIGNKS